MSFASVDSGSLPSGRPDRDRFDERPKSVEQWLAQLPVADPNVTGRRILDVLEAASATKLKPEARLGHLTQLERIVAYVVDSLRKRYHLQPLPLPSRSAQAARLLFQLSEAMVRGYRLVLLTDPRGLFGLRRGQRARAQLGVCRHTGVVLMECWQLYRRPPPGVWITLHGSWRVASAQRIHRRQMPALDGRRSVDDVYKQLLLTAACDPWRMPRGQVQVVHRMLGELARYAVFGEVDGKGGPAFLVNAEGDEEPCPVDAAQGQPTENALYLQTDGLCRVLSERRDKQLRTDRGGDDRGDDDATTMQDMIDALARTTSRAFDRSPQRGSVSLVFGLSRIRRVLEVASEKAATEPVGNGSDFGATELTWEGAEDLDDDIWEISSQLRADAEHLVAAPVEGFSGREYGDAETEQERGWHLVNRSPGGYCLHCPENSGSRARVGEIVLLSHIEGGHGGRGETAVVRWLKREGGAGMRIGVELLGTEPLPVMAAVLNPDMATTDPRESLLLQAGPDGKPDETLVVPPMQVATEYRVEVRGSTLVRELELLEERQSSPVFRQFAFRGMGH